MTKTQVFSCLILLLGAHQAFGGLVERVPVVIDTASKTVLGDMLTARFSDNDVEFIGCGSRHFDDGFGGSFVFGFCQAGDADGVTQSCTTMNAVLIDAIHSISDYSFLTFSYDDNDECTRVGVSTQSFYLPEAAGLTDDDDDDDDDDD